MDKSRRGFVSNVAAVGLGVFAYGAAQNSVAGGAKAGVATDDVLIAMPGGLYYAIPKAELTQYAVSQEAFQREELRRAEMSDEIRSRGGSGDRRPPAALGVRG